MKKFSIRFIYPSTLLIILIFLLSHQISNVPPIGGILDPYIGCIQNENTEDEEGILNLPFCKNSIDVFYDERSVPHVFAKNEHDMFLAQGYLVAKDRLWQMDFMSYASAGRLSELFGQVYLENDRLQRRLGYLSAAKTTLKYIEKDNETKMALDAFTQGVNAYITSLQYKDYPFEYKLFDYKPEPWSNLKSILIMKYVASMLSGYEEDISMAHMLLALGKSEFKKLYPEYSPLDISKQFDFSKNLYINDLPYADYINYSFLSNKGRVKPSLFNKRLGSNNWAINAFKSQTGYAILCNDPHLSLTLPSIWYEIQLNSQKSNSYGVSIPGTPGIIIGYNEHIAWGVTNGATDVKDWYKLRIKSDYSEYEIDNKWKKMDMIIEKIDIKGRESFYDTIYKTIHGPIVVDNKFNDNPDAKNYALKWTLHEPSNEFLAFIYLNKAKNYSDFKRAIAYYKCPIQNFIFASTEDTIAIHHQGTIYKKWNGQGRFLLDGTKSSHLYNTHLKYDSLPHICNPKTGYVYSANNFPNFDAVNNYINGYYTEARGHRINALLAGYNKFSVLDMEKMQLDNTNDLARMVLPKLLDCISTYNNKSDKSNEVKEMLVGWKYSFDEGSVPAYFYYNWWNNISDLTWDELKIQEFYLRPPDPQILIKLILSEKKSIYFDKINTDFIETADDIIREAYSITLKDFNHQTWGDFNKINIDHLSKIEGLGSPKFSSSGHPDAINAVSKNWGPSWRMIVNMKTKPEGFGIYAGGQSGNLASDKFDNFIPDWKKGKYYKLKLYYSLKEASIDSKKHLILK